MKILFMVKETLSRQHLGQSSHTASPISAELAAAFSNFPRTWSEQIHAEADNYLDQLRFQARVAAVDDNLTCSSSVQR
jgi:hypothetical protein